MKGATTYVVEPNKHLTFWPEQTGKQRKMTVSIGDAPGETKPFDFARSHCTMLPMDNTVTCLLVLVVVVVVIVVVVVVFIACLFVQYSIFCLLVIMHRSQSVIIVAVLLARDIMLSALYAIANPSVCPSVCPSVRPLSVCLSHWWISRKRLKLGSCNFHHTVAPSL